MPALYSKQFCNTFVTAPFDRKKSSPAIKRFLVRGKERELKAAVDAALEMRKTVQQKGGNILMSRRTVLEPKMFCACTAVLLYIWCHTMYEADGDVFTEDLTSLLKFSCRRSEVCVAQEQPQHMNTKARPLQCVATLQPSKILYRIFWLAQKLLGTTQ